MVSCKIYRIVPHSFFSPRGMPAPRAICYKLALMTSEGLKIFHNKSAAGVFVYSDDWLGWVHVGYAMGCWIRLECQRNGLDWMEEHRPRLSPFCRLQPIASYTQSRTHNYIYSQFHTPRFDDHQCPISGRTKS